MQLAVVWMMDTAGFPPMTSTVTGVVCALVHNFVWHRRWTWADRTNRSGRVVRTFMRFVAANGTVSVVGTLLLLPALEPVPVVAANVGAIGILGFVNFTLANRTVFVMPGTRSRGSKPGRSGLRVRSAR